MGASVHGLQGQTQQAGHGGPDRIVDTGRDGLRQSCHDLFDGLAGEMGQTGDEGSSLQQPDGRLQIVIILRVPGVCGGHISSVQGRLPCRIALTGAPPRKPGTSFR